MNGMYQGSLMIDSWIREAQEALMLVEDVEAKLKNKSPEQDPRSIDGGVRSKLLAVGVMLDRLESLLHNPPSNLSLTEDDLEYRWKMLSDIKNRTRELAQCLYSFSSPKTAGSSGAPGIEESSSGAANIAIEDQLKLGSPEATSELVMPFIANESTEIARGEVKGHGSFTLKTLVWTIFWTVTAILGAAGLLFVLFILASMI